MDKRRKWPLHQKANHSDPPYYQNSPRNYQKHTNPHQQHGGHPHNFHPYSHPNKGYSRPQHGYGGYQKSVPGGGAIGFYKTPPPPLPKIQDKNVGGAMAPPSSGGNTSSDVVTLIVENNNLKRMIVLHVNLMQEQTDSLAAKDKELDDQHDKLDVMLAQNQELKLANAQLEAKVEELRKQLRRKNKRPHDDDDDDHPLPPAATQQKVLLCNAETQTLLEEPVRIHPPQHHQHQQAEILSRILSQEQKQLELKPRLPHKADDHVPALPKSKARGEFNGKKVSTIFLHRRLNLEEEELLHQEEEKRHQQLQMEEESEEHLLLDGEVILEEVVEDDIFHGALEPVEIEVATESFVGPEEELVADVNGHMDEGEEESSSADDDLNSHDSDDENEEPDSDTEEDAEEDEEEPEKNRMNSTDYNVADEKAIMPAAHSTPNHQQKYLGIEELEREDQQNQENELEEVEQMEVDSLERYISEDQSDMDLEERLEQLSKIEKQLREISKANKLHPKISKDMKQQRGKSTDQLLETAKDGKSKDHNQQQQSNDERLRQPTREQQLEATTPKAMPNAVAPKAGIHPNPPAANASLLKAKSADMTPTPKVSGAAVQQDAAGSSPIIANHQTSESSPADPVKKPRLQVKIRQHSLFNDKKQISVLKRNKEKKTDSTDRPLANANSNIAVERDLHKNESSAPISDTNEEQSLEERMRRKLQEHLQKERVRQSQAEKLGLLKKPSKESPTSDLIYPPIAPPTASSSSEIITPAPTPTTTLNITPASTPQPTPTSSQETQTMVASLKLDKIALPLTPQSVSSSSGISSIAKPTNVLNNRALHTYSKAPARSGKNRSMYRFATYPYTTRSWEDHEFHCDNEFFLEEADELLSDNPSIKIPAWRDVPVPPSSDKKNIENLSDEVFIQRHDKYVKDEIERKRRDARSIREQIRIDQLRSRHNQDEVVVPPDTLPATTFYPLPNDIEAIQFVTELPVQAFGENMVNMEALDDFSLPWLDAVHATTSIAKSKAQAVPVATLASKKIPTTAAEARHQEMNSSYVYLKRRKRQRRR
ncbi:hypothetical protein KR009_003524 [Drosophila setifemur]|nr:hypothetical protein KR009_003524 [Drosophila setifemur]